MLVPLDLGPKLNSGLKNNTRLLFHFGRHGSASLILMVGVYSLYAFLGCGACC